MTGNAEEEEEESFYLVNFMNYQHEANSLLDCRKTSYIKQFKKEKKKRKTETQVSVQAPVICHTFRLSTPAGSL